MLRWSLWVDQREDEMETARRVLLERMLGRSTADPSAKFAAAKAGSALPAPEELVLLLNRSSFGIRPQELALAQQLGFDAWLEQQLAPEQIDVSQLEDALSRNLPTLAFSNAQLIQQAQANQNAFQSLIELRTATLARQIFSGRQLYETMVEFWSNHFSVEHISGPIRQFKTPDDRLIRAHALGRFGDLLNANARSPAMLFYLDNFASVASGPNENYARELLELHTLGVNGGYSEEDVREVARAFTGWTINVRGNYDFVFAGINHDFGAKRVLGVDLPAGQGIEDGQQVLDMLALHPSTAQFIATKLVRRFVDDSPPASLVDAVAQSFLASGGDTRAMLRTIFHSDEFKTSVDRKVKRPAEYIIGALRSLGVEVEGGNPYRQVNFYLEQLGQLPFMWPAPNGYPDVQGYWINTTAWLSRWNFAFALVEGRLGGGIKIDTLALAGEVREPVALVDRLSALIVKRPLLDEDRQALIELAAGGAPTGLALDTRSLRLRVQEVAGVLLASPYFHFR
jgi:uncharacterized protein (DUF1800 family)